MTKNKDKIHREVKKTKECVKINDNSIIQTQNIDTVEVGNIF